MLRRLCCSLAILVMLPAVASASAFTFYGPHLGFTQGPDLFVIGGQLQWNGVAPRVAFVPEFDIASGNDQTVVSMSGDFHWQLSDRTRWQPYVGGGVGVNFPSGDRVRNTDAQPAGHLIVGAAVPNTGRGRFFTELKLGLGDDPDLKVLAGLNLRGR